MTREKVIVGLDVGTCNVRMAAAKIKEGDSNPQIIGVSKISSQGVRRGVVVDVVETSKNISRAKEILEKNAGIKIDHVFVNVGGSHINCRLSRGVVAVSRADGEISEEDKNRAVNASSAISVSPNFEILHTLPRRFTVYSQDSLKDPVGMHGVRLEVDSLLVEGSTPFIKNLIKCLRETDLSAEGILVSPLASSRSILNKRQKELGVLVLDIGGGTTGMAVFEEGDILHCKVLPVGSMHITNDIAIGLRTSVDTAEKVKLEYGSLRPSQAGRRDMIDLSKLEESENEQVSRLEVIEIIEARVNELFDLVNKELKKIDRLGLLPAGVVLVGEGVKLPGLVEFAKNKLKLPASMGCPQEFEGVIDEINDPGFAAVCGLINSGLADEAVSDSSLMRDFSLFKFFPKKMRDWMKNFIP